MTTLLILATEGGIPPTNPWAKLAVPIGMLVFIGSVYLLVRSNLGTRRGYLVLSSCLWGFGLILALFWTFGAPGTPQTTGPQNLPGQELDHYLPKWIPYAPTSNFAQTYPTGLEAFGPVPADADQQLIDEGVADIQSFFSSLDDPYAPLLTPTDEPVETLYTVADDGRPVIAVTFAPTCTQAFGCLVADDGTVTAADEGGDADVAFGDVIPTGERTTLFANFDRGNPLLPSLVMVALMFTLWAVHTLLLYRDERRESGERAEEFEDTTEDSTEQPVPA